jgi:uncharacterized protein (DUF58 family)
VTAASGSGTGAGPPPERSAPLQWRPRALLLYAGGALLTGFALLERDPVPLFLALPLLLGPLAAGLFLPRRRITGYIEWKDLGSGPDVRVSGRIVFDPPVAPTSVYPTFHPPDPLIEVEAAELGEARQPTPALTFELHYRAPYPSLVEIPRPDAVWRDPLGLAESPITIAGGALTVERFPPEVHRIGTFQLRRTTPLPGETRSRALGGAGEFFAVRPSVAGDTVRQINWRATARAGRLLANDYLLERTGDVVLLVDLRPSALGPRRDQTLLSVARAGALGLASGFLEQKARVGLGLYGEFLEAVPLGTGRRHRYRIVQRLRAARLSPEPGPPERLAISLRQYFPPGVLTILLSSFQEEDSLLLLPYLRRRGYPAIALSPSAIPLVTATLDPSAPDDALAGRLLRLVRRRQLAEIWREAPAVDWEDYWSLSGFVRLLRRPARRGGDLAT